MTLQQLQYVVALDTHRHFVRAAESCFVAQPTLSMQVKKLEEEIGLSIFDRSTHPLEPTPMGVKFIAQARQILRDVQQLKDMVNEDRNQLAGTYRMGIIPTLAPYVLPLFLKEFSDRHPEVRLELREMQSEQIMAELKQDLLDIGLLVTPLDEPQLREQPIFHEPFLLYANANNPVLSQEEIHPETLDHDGLWLLEQGHCFRNQVLNICGKTRSMHSRDNLAFESGSIETLKNMIQQLAGYTLIPELAVVPQLDGERVRRFAEPEPTREVSLVTHISFTRELLLQELHRCIVSKVPERFQRNRQSVRINWR